MKMILMPSHLMDAFSILLTLSLYCVANSLIPTVCVENATVVKSGVCCPSNSQNGLICGGSSRGICSPLRVHRYEVTDEVAMDDRVHWPLRFIRIGCHCKENFFGIACEECKFGWSGPDCNLKQKKVRNNIQHLSREEKERLIDLLLKSYKFPSGYSLLIENDNRFSDPVRNPKWVEVSVLHYLVGIHRHASRYTLFSDHRACKKYGKSFLSNHKGLSFLLWHRAFNLIWERWLEKISRHFGDYREFTFPYWNWINKNSCDICTNDLFGAEGEETFLGRRLSKGSPFRDWIEYCKEPMDGRDCFGCHASFNFKWLTRSWSNFSFPKSSEVDYVMTIPDFYHWNETLDIRGCQSFHMGLEGFCGHPSETPGHNFMHNRMHNIVNGTFCCTAASPNDPLFPVHHSQIDRLLQKWFMKYKPSANSLPSESKQLGQCRDCNLKSFYPTIRLEEMFQNTEQLGYVYDTYEYN